MTECNFMMCVCAGGQRGTCPQTPLVNLYVIQHCVYTPYKRSTLHLENLPRWSLATGMGLFWKTDKFCRWTPLTCHYHIQPYIVQSVLLHKHNCLQAHLLSFLKWWCNCLIADKHACLLSFLHIAERLVSFWIIQKTEEKCMLYT